jgi:predicted short-subunit dehydrogenase-like oxidoreductase (DUF2520 family)
MNIILIGSGNVAHHIGQALAREHNITQVFSRSPANAQSLAHALNADAVSSMNEIKKDADLYLISVSDDAIRNIAAELPSVKGIVAHTSGTTTMDVLNRFENYGVLYPFQTFSKERKIYFNNIPVLIEGSSSDVISNLRQTANSISDNIFEIDSGQRAMLHLSAVFSSNFVNHFYAIAKDILDKAGLPFEILHPLIIETASKATKIDPLTAQTGPAVRNDTEIINKHVEILNNIPDRELKELYLILSKRILKMSQKK